jgi:hypothetical protein
MRADVQGTFHGIEATPRKSGRAVSVAQGDVIELDRIEDVLRYLKIDLIELKLDGEFGRGRGCNAADIAKIQKQVDAEKAKQPPPERLATVTFDGASYVRPND